MAAHLFLKYIAAEAFDKRHRNIEPAFPLRRGVDVLAPRAGALVLIVVRNSHHEPWNSLGPSHILPFFI